MKHHIVASSYLEGFSENPSNRRRYSKVSVYDRVLEEIREQAVGNVASVKDFYAKRLENGALDHGTEEFFARVENGGVSAIRKISSGKPVSAAELSAVSLFVTVQSVRGYSYISGLVSSIAESVSESLDELFPDAETAVRNMSEWFENGKPIQMSDPEGAVRHFSDPETRKGIMDYLHVPQLAVNAVLNPTDMLGGMSAFQTVDSFEKMFLFAPAGESFATSDVPVAVIDPDRLGVRPGFRKPGIALACPLSRNLYAIFADPVGRPPRPPRTAVVSAQFVRTANAQVIARCDRSAVAGNRGILIKSVHDHLRALGRPPFARKFRISENP